MPRPTESADPAKRATAPPPRSAARSEMPAPFASLLRAARTARRLSQLDLSMASGVSQRHLSFLESGRARPSRQMIVQLTEALDVPMRDRNRWLVAAGFAPMFRARTLDDPEMAPVMAAIRMMLDGHEPYPAVVIDRDWNVLLANNAFEGLGAILGTDIWRRTCGDGPPNILRLTFHPEGLRRFARNWDVVAPVLWQRARRDAEANGDVGPDSVIAELSQHLEARVLRGVDNGALAPVLALDLEANGVRAAFFTVISTFGTPQDVTADEIRIETFFPADAATARLLGGGANVFAGNA